MAIRLRWFLSCLVNTLHSYPLTAPSTPGYDSNLCPACAARNGFASPHCRTCGATLVRHAWGAVSFWILGDVKMALAGKLAKAVGHSLGCPVVVQPGRLDPRPSDRPGWQGRSGTVLLNQGCRRQQLGCLANVAIVADTVAPSAADSWIFGYAYVEAPAACVSLAPLQMDRPSDKTLLKRAQSICLHEIGHTLGLIDHPEASGISCAMVGEVDAHRISDPESYPTHLCPQCLRQAREKMNAYGAMIGENWFTPRKSAVFAGRYELHAFAGKGGMGTVWKAKDLELDQDVAIKFVQSDGFDGHREVRLTEEAAKARQLNHPHIVRVFDLARDAGAGGLIMDWIEGTDLESLRKQHPGSCFDPDEIREWVAQLCGAVAAAHDAGVIHYDLKPHNCLIDKNGKLILTDFGLARTPDQAGGSFLGMRSHHFGTQTFGAPERKNGTAPAISQDIYGLGATLYQLLTGRAPRTEQALPQKGSAGPMPAINAVRTAAGPPRRPPVPEAWEQTIAACLEINPARRPKSAREVARRLGLTQEPTPTPSSLSSSSGTRFRVTHLLARLFQRLFP